MFTINCISAGLNPYFACPQLCYRRWRGTVAKSERWQVAELFSAARGRLWQQIEPRPAAGRRRHTASSDGRAVMDNAALSRAGGRRATEAADRGQEDGVVIPLTAVVVTCQRQPRAYHQIDRRPRGRVAKKKHYILCLYNQRSLNFIFGCR